MARIPLDPVRRGVQPVAVVLFLVAAVWTLKAYADPDWSVQRERMMAAIEEDMRRTEFYTGEASLDATVAAALRRVERHRFVPARVRDRAYVNAPLPIGNGQTISQPYIVALMTQLVRPGPDRRILEVGTGSGYQAAVLAELAGEVHSIEIIPELADTARERLAGL